MLLSVGYPRIECVLAEVDPDQWLIVDNFMRTSVGIYARGNVSIMTWLMNVTEESRRVGTSRVVFVKHNHDNARDGKSPGAGIR